MSDSQADALVFFGDQTVLPPGGWHNPTAAGREDFRVTAQVT
jgi:hypothetical protein